MITGDGRNLRTQSPENDLKAYQNEDNVDELDRLSTSRVSKRFCCINGRTAGRCHIQLTRAKSTKVATIVKKIEKRRLLRAVAQLFGVAVDVDALSPIMLALAQSSQRIL